MGFNWKNVTLLKKGLKEMRHRGPDDNGTFLDKKISLGHNRLSIIDLSKSGRQPLSNEDKTIWIIFNGEIYNYKEIRNSLKQKHRFKSNTDTEVLIHLYEEEGVEMLHKLYGMFAFCIYDSKKQILFLARDRIGIKPLYYYHKGKEFIFASEIKAMLETSKIKRELNKEALSSYLTFRSNVLDETLIKRIKKLTPAHSLTYNLRLNTFNIERYWEFPKEKLFLSEKEFSKKLFSFLEKSVKSRLVADVPYGAYLSGGVDSGTIVSLMSKHSKVPIKTFSVGFKEDQDSELKEARFLANKLKTDHHELIISRNSIKDLPKIVYQSDEPNADPTIIPTYYLAEYSKKYCTVILTGEGADEILGGYPQYKFMKIHKSIIKKLPKGLKSIILLAIKKFPKKFLNKGFRYATALGDKGIERLSNYIMSNDYAEQYLNQIAIFNQEEQEELLNYNPGIYNKYQKNFLSKDLISDCQNMDFNTSMRDGLLMKVDKNTMAFSVEARVPFLDHRVVEYTSQIPSEIKLKGLKKDKYILRQAVKNLLPKQTSKRRKRHFFVPIDLWLDKEIKPLINQFLSKEYIERQKIFNYTYVKKIMRDFNKSRLFYARQLWSLMVFQIWYKQFIENEKVKI